MSSSGQVPTAQVAGLNAALTALALAIQDENVTIASNVNLIDFQGAGVTATVGATGEVIVTIPGGGTGGSGTGQGLVDFASTRLTTGNIALNSTGAYVNVSTATDLVLTASAGDVIEATFGAKITASASTFAVFDVVTVVGGSPVNSFTTRGAPSLTASGGSWGSGGISTSGVLLTGPRHYALQAGDISSGTVTLRLRARCGSVTVSAGTDPDLYFQAKNLGPQL